MGMFDSFIIDCPSCGKELEYQSKSGECSLFSFREGRLPTLVAVGMEGDIAKCKCGKKWRLDCGLPKVVKKVRLIATRKEEDYSGN